MPPPQQHHHGPGLQPWLALCLFSALSAGGAVKELHSSARGQELSGQMALLLEKQLSGNDVDLGHAKQLGGEALHLLLQTQLGLFCAFNLAAALYAGACLATQWLFVGQLTASETSKLAERLLAFVALKAVVLCTRSPHYGDLVQWLAWTAAMCYSSMFVKLASLRGDALLSSPSATLAQHCRILLLLGGLLAQDCCWIASYVSTLRRGSLSHALLYLFDAMFVAVDAALSLTKYAYAALEHHQAALAEARGQEREPWEGRGALQYWLDLTADVALGGLVLGHQLHVWWLRGPQLQLVDGTLFLGLRYTLGALGRRLRGHLLYRRLQRQLRHTFPDAMPEQLAEDPCPICLEAMRAGKQLPCSHVVHVSCLCAWVQQQSFTGQPSCPLCRASLDIQPPRKLEQAKAPGQHSMPRLARQPVPAQDASHLGNASSMAKCSSACDGPAEPTRRVTRLQARLAAANAPASSPAPTAAISSPATANPAAGRRYVTRPRRCIDGILD